MSLFLFFCSFVSICEYLPKTWRLKGKTKTIFSTQHEKISAGYVSYVYQVDVCMAHLFDFIFPSIRFFLSFLFIFDPHMCVFTFPPFVLILPTPYAMDHTRNSSSVHSTKQYVSKPLFWSFSLYLHFFFQETCFGRQVTLLKNGPLPTLCEMHVILCQRGCTNCDGAQNGQSLHLSLLTYSRRRSSPSPE